MLLGRPIWFRPLDGANRSRPSPTAPLSAPQLHPTHSRPRRFAPSADGWVPPVSTAFYLPPLKLGSLALPPACHAAVPEPPQASSTTPEESQGLYLALEPFHSLSFALSRPQSPFLSELAPPPPSQFRPRPTTSDDVAWCGVLLELRRNLGDPSRSF